MSASNRRPILLAAAAQHLTKMRLARNKNRKRSCGSLRYRRAAGPRPQAPEPLRAGARASPSPGMLINHITGNRKSLCQLMQVCCKPDTGKITHQLLRTFSDQVGVELAQC